MRKWIRFWYVVIAYVYSGLVESKCVKVFTLIPHYNHIWCGYAGHGYEIKL
jgi:hypothetical protein